MPPHFPQSRVPFEGPFPSLPIVTPDPPRRSAVEKYGSMYLLGLAGLVVVVGLVSWFAIGVWSLRAVWSDIYILHDESRPIAERVQAAYALSRDPRVTPPQRWEMCLRKPLPELARYVLAESLTAEIVRADPRHYSLMVARSPGWPDWLRLLLVRPLAYGAAEGLASPREPLVELGRHHDPAIRLWADFARSASPDVATDPAAGKELDAHGRGRRSRPRAGRPVARGPAGRRGGEGPDPGPRHALAPRSSSGFGPTLGGVGGAGRSPRAETGLGIAPGGIEGGGHPGRRPELPEIRTR